MKNKLLIIIIVVCLCAGVLCILIGCVKKENTNTDIPQVPEISEKIIENIEGSYVVQTSEDSEIEEQASIELDNGKITVYDDFAMVSESGEYQIEGNKITGVYSTIAYLNHEKGGETTEETIEEKFEYEILEDGSLKDLLGYGSYLDKNFHKDDVYKLERPKKIRVPKGEKIPEIE